jgi:hypothetical protein
MATRINNIEELKKLCSDEQSHDCFVLLNYGIRSSKSVFMNEDGTFSVINEIDDSEDEFSELEIMDPNVSIIGKAIANNSFFTYEDWSYNV